MIENVLFRSIIRAYFALQGRKASHSELFYYSVLPKYPLKNPIVRLETELSFFRLSLLYGDIVVLSVIDNMKRLMNLKLLRLKGELNTVQLPPPTHYFSSHVKNLRFIIPQAFYVSVLMQHYTKEHFHNRFLIKNSRSKVQ